MIRHCTIFLAFALGAAGSTAHCATYVFLDFGGGFDAALDSLYAPTFSPTDKSDIKLIIAGKLAAMYSGFDITFAPVTSGGAEDVVDFDETLGPDSLPAPGTLGWALFDWNNLIGYNEANVLTANFGSILDETPPLIAAKIQIATALAGTAAHELGHSYGLSHYDAYGDPSIVSPLTAGGAQNAFIMATGPTGITEIEREADRTFSRNSIAKLEFTGVAPVKLTSTPLVPAFETGSPHSAFATAQDLTPSFQHLPISDTWGMKIHGGGIGPGGSASDFYKFTLPTAGLFNAEVLSLNRYANGVESNVTLYSSSMTPIITGNDVYYGASGLDYSTMTGTFQESDPLIMNLFLPPGTYFLEVIPEAGGTETGPPGGFYDLYINTEADFTASPSQSAALPEPASSGLLLIALGAAGSVRRKLRRVK